MGGSGCTLLSDWLEPCTCLQWLSEKKKKQACRIAIIPFVYTVTHTVLLANLWKYIFSQFPKSSVQKVHTLLYWRMEFSKCAKPAIFRAKLF